MFLNRNLLPLALCALLLGGCSTSQTGFLGLAPAGDRRDYIYARDLYAQQNYTKAIEELTEYIYKTKNVKRREARAYRLLGMSYEQLGDLSKALEVYLEALEFHPNNVPLLLAAASLYQRTDLTDRSMELYERALAQEPNNLEALAGQAANYSAMGFYSKARSFYDKFFELNPEAGPQYRARYAYTFLRQRNYQDAFIHITMALAQNDQSPDFWLLSAKAARGLNRPQDALSDMEAALALAPNRKDLLAHKALWLYEAGQYRESFQTAERILQHEPGNQLALFIQAMDEYYLGRPQDSRRHMTAVREGNKDSFIGRVADKLLTAAPQR
ncbi:tetratricopeptide repeat protein [Candidatus Avelusimicrobium alvi]|uniref:tetratricopeptide repeat protein n=1 Tax=Candidatus Avelusimicrobium alvi TaxID=3416221 RepID=UPI003D0CD4D9